MTQRHLANRYYLPFARRFGCQYPDSGIDHIIYNCATPIGDDRLMLVQWLYRNDSEAQCRTQELIDPVPTVPSVLSLPPDADTVLHANQVEKPTATAPTPWRAWVCASSEAMSSRCLARRAVARARC